MSFDEFVLSLDNNYPPDSIRDLAVAVWHDYKGDWKRARNIAQSVATADGAWVHAYLHRKYGDIWNSDYWYSRAGRQRPDLSLEDERENIINTILMSEN